MSKEIKMDTTADDEKTKPVFEWKADKYIHNQIGFSVQVEEEDIGGFHPGDTTLRMFFNIAGVSLIIFKLLTVLEILQIAQSLPWDFKYHPEVASDLIRFLRHMKSHNGVVRGVQCMKSIGNVMTSVVQHVWTDYIAENTRVTERHAALWNLGQVIPALYAMSSHEYDFTSYRGGIYYCLEICSDLKIFVQNMEHSVTLPYLRYHLGLILQHLQLMPFSYADSFNDQFFHFVEQMAKTTNFCPSRWVRDNDGSVQLYHSSIEDLITENGCICGWPH